MWLRPSPPTVPPGLTAQFGEPELVFGPNMRFRVVAAVCGGIFLVMGVAFFLLGLRGMPLADWVSGRLVAPLVALGLVILIGTRVVPLSWVFVCPGGVVRTRGAAWDGIGWAEVERFEDANVGREGVTIRQCRLVLTGGGEWGFLAEYVADYPRLTEALGRKVSTRVAAPIQPRAAAAEPTVAPDARRQTG